MNRKYPKPFNGRFSICLFFALMFLQIAGFAQTLPVGIFNGVEDTYRRSQLLGLDTSNSSYLIRPLFINQRNLHRFDDQDDDLSLADFRKSLFQSHNQLLKIYALPIVWQQQFNSHHPYGMNDGAMIHAKGYQTQFSAGIYAKFGPLSIQLRPEVVYAQNSHFTQTFERDNGSNFATAYRNYMNRIDLPERFGNGTYKKVNWGQSSVRLTFDPVSIGISNENLWWGPGVRNSLLMTNNSDGFKHATLNTTRPIKTYIGSFEAQLIGGRLEGSGIEVPNLPGYNAKPNNWRYLSAVAVTWQPKWVPNLYLGFDRAYVVYKKDMEKGFRGYFPIFSALEKKSYAPKNLGDRNEEDLRKSDQNLSLFARWVMPESRAEVYVQFGRNDHAWDWRDAIAEPEHTQAYIAGFRKLIPFGKATDEFIQAGVEFTHLEGSSTQRLRDYPFWYAHHNVVAGYTNNGQVFGAGIGPGSNMQSLDVNWVKGLKKIGITLERTLHNNDLYYRAFGTAPNTDFRRHWVDLSFIGNFNWDYKNFVLNTQLGLIHSLNYQYQFQNQSPTDIFVWDKADVNNFHAKVGLMYRW